MNEASKIVIPFEEIDLLHAKLCRAVGDPKRLQILYALAEAPFSVGALADLLDSPQPTISRHLAILRESGMVSTTRDGTTVTYRLAVPEMITVIDSMRSILRTVIARQANSLGEDTPPE
jgi:ArsR family transcriptional regulator